jgi:5-methylcytosine-specific restriction endonuclease McrA
LVVSQAYALLGERQRKILIRKMKKKGLLEVIPEDVRNLLVDTWITWVKIYLLRLRREDLSEWKIKIFKKYNYACVKCKSNKLLNVHHIFNYADYPELANDYKNGIVLCRKCHKMFHTLYGKRKNNLKQLLEFLRVGHL